MKNYVLYYGEMKQEETENRNLRIGVLVASFLMKYLYLISCLICSNHIRSVIFAKDENTY